MDLPSKKLNTIRDTWIAFCTEMVEALPTAERPEALSVVRELVVQRLTNLGFQITRYGEAPAQILVASRGGTGARLGLGAHYDVETLGEDWLVRGDRITNLNGRIYGRGIGDNLGPLALRLAVLEERTEPTPPLLWIIQGEEEIGSPQAHNIYPALDLPEVTLWVEETGYFELDGGLRLLNRDLTERASAILEPVLELTRQESRQVTSHDRYMNKAFGQHRCPFLQHLVNGAPYVALGPNDDNTRIHAVNESLPEANINIAIKQFQALLTAAAQA